MQYLSFDFRQLWNLDLYDRHHAAFHGAVKFVIPILVSPAISIQNPRFSVTLVIAQRTLLSNPPLPCLVPPTLCKCIDRE